MRPYHARLKNHTPLNFQNMDISRPDLWTQPPSSKPNDDQGSSGNYGCQHRVVSPSTGMNYKKRNSLNTAHTTPASTVSTTLEFPHRQTDLLPSTNDAEWIDNSSIGSASETEPRFLQGVKRMGRLETICGLRFLRWLCDSNELLSTFNAGLSTNVSPLTSTACINSTPGVSSVTSSNQSTSTSTTVSQHTSQLPAQYPPSPSPAPVLSPSLASSATQCTSSTSASGAAQSTPSSMSTGKHSLQSTLVPTTSGSSVFTVMYPGAQTMPSEAGRPSSAPTSSPRSSSSSPTARASSSARVSPKSNQPSRNTGVIIGVLSGVIVLLLVALLLRFRHQKRVQHARHSVKDAEQPNPSSGSVSPLIYRYQTTQNQSDRQSVRSSSFEHLAYYEGNGSGADIQTSDDNSVLARQRRDAIISILDSESSIGIPLDILSRSHESHHALGVETVDGVAF
ncbi:hypothetical protein BJ138DRAFT_752666 [Hygrophoropsis aurantiaca]|uniref:Uncharacterized protein n=1 Tax=Hygrophoropsis aurantiaca TaxID=72124 RepID=A0ACB7ZWS3_9AGAM|nr:hypothetical protein BJ138DRAFT_752666 [Hygrophoropsis aurantiaca]